jgi:hypothetical protein
MFTVNNGGTRFAQATKAGQTSMPREKLHMRIFQWSKGEILQDLCDMPFRLMWNQGQPRGRKWSIEGTENLASCGPSDLTIM